ncbi:MAG: Maf family protein [Alphaproteobacteria bacterium]|nr:Maf family protein [Alphaproteobacteria bacterium]
MSRTLWLPDDAYAQARVDLLQRFWTECISLYEIQPQTHAAASPLISLPILVQNELESTTFGRGETDLILGIKTMSCVGARLLYGAQTEKEIKHFIGLLSGRRHRIYTAFKLSYGDKTVRRLVETRVKIKRFSKHEAEDLISTCHKAGSLLPLYEGVIFTEEVHGCPHNVHGLPAASLHKALVGIGAL